MRSFIIPAIQLAAAVGPAAQTAAQTPLDSLAVRLGAMTAVSGFEQAMADTILSLVPGSVRDRAGNVLLTVGSGAPHRLAACPMNEPGFVVGGVRPDGYLTLRRVGPAPGRLADQQLEGQRVVVFGRRGAVPGVVGVPSIHLARGRSARADEPFTFDDAFVDLGARDAREVNALGIAELAPVTLEKRPHRYGVALLAAPVAGRRAACAALIDAARRRREGVKGTTTVAFIVEHGFSRRGLGTIVRAAGGFDVTVLLEAARPDSEAQGSPPAPGLGEYQIWWVPVRYGGSPVETVSLDAVGKLAARLGAFIGGDR